MNLQAIGLLLVLAALPAQAEVVDIKWNADGGFAHATEIRVKGVVEVCGKITAGPTIDWSFKSSGPLESNVHFHEGKEVSYPARHAAATAIKDQLIVRTDQEFCWMWSNRTQQPVTMSMELMKVK